MLTKRIVPALLSLFAWCLPCAAQTTVVDVKDESTVKCPVRMSGTIELTESEGEEVVQELRTWVNRTSFASTLSATNLSNVPILAMVTFTSIGNSMGPLVGEDRLLDAFFDNDKEIAPGQTWTKKLDDNGVMFTPVPKGAVKHAPAAWSQRDMQKEKGSTAAIEHIRSMLDVAASR